MGNNLFGARIAERIAKALGKRLLPITLTKRNPTYDASDPTGAGTTSETTYTCRGIIDRYDQRRMGGTAIQEGAPVVLILAATLPDTVEPALDDFITVGGKEHQIVGPIVSDPDLATYTAQLRE